MRIGLLAYCVGLLYETAMGNPINMLGRTFGRLTVIRSANTKSRSGQMMWVVRCGDCGAEYSHAGYEIRKGFAGSCRCKMVANNDLVGRKFGLLTVLRRGDKHPKKSSYYWICQCRCGACVSRISDALKKSKLPSCGCARKISNLKYGKKPTREIKEYGIWHAIRQRCGNPNDKKYALYGGRGIKLCSRWQTFEAFIGDMGPRPSTAHSIDRIDNNGDYGPDNCRWTTIDVQQANRRNTVYLTHNGARRTLKEWADITGIALNLIRMRVSKNMPAHRVLDPRHPLSRCDSASDRAMP